MRKVIYFLWHKVAMLGVMYYFSLVFTTICLPLMLLHYRTPIVDYYIFSLLSLFIGGFAFNIILTKIYPIKEEELKEGFPKSFIITAIFGKIIVYLILCSVIWLLTDNTVLSVYLLIFWIAGGFFWFSILRGYIIAKNDYKGIETPKGITWQGKVMVFSIPISLILGYFIFY